MFRQLSPLALALVGAPLLSGAAAAQSGVLDQDNSAPTNITVWMEFSPFFYEQLVEVGVDGVLDGFSIRVAPSQSSTPTLPVNIYEWDANFNTTGALLWSGGVASASPNMTWVFTDTSAAGAALAAGDFILIQVGIDSATSNGWNLSLNSGWDSQLNQPYAQYPELLFVDGVAEQIDRLCFQTWMLTGMGSNLCEPAVANSTGSSASIAGTGSADVAANDLTLSVTQLPPNQFGYFLNSRTQGFLPGVGGSQGNLCLVGNVGRYNSAIFDSGASGVASLGLDLSQTPTPTGPVAILAGETWYFQCWYRDVNPTATSNFSNALEVLFQ